MPFILILSEVRFSEGDIGEESGVKLVHGRLGQLPRLDEPNNGFFVKFDMVRRQRFNAVHGFAIPDGMHKLPKGYNRQGSFGRIEATIIEVVGQHLAFDIEGVDNSLLRKITNQLCKNLENVNRHKSLKAHKALCWPKLSRIF